MIRLVFLCGLILASVCFTAAQTMPALRDELVRMRDRDQAARIACTGTAEEQVRCSVKVGEEIDRPNTRRLNEILAAHGFPTVPLVGKEGIGAFVLLMQHSGDIELRKKSRAGMKQAFESNVISPSQYSGFLDRLLVDQRKPQIYGSNFEIKDGKLVMSRVKDPKKLDKRRKALGLPAIAEYANMLKEAYKLEVVVPPGN